MLNWTLWESAGTCEATATTMAYATLKKGWVVDETACNYDENAVTDNGTCEYPEDSMTVMAINDADGDGV